MLESQCVPPKYSYQIKEKQLNLVWMTKQIMESANSQEIEVYEVVWLAKPQEVRVQYNINDPTPAQFFFNDPTLFQPLHYGQIYRYLYSVGCTSKDLIENFLR